MRPRIALLAGTFLAWVGCSVYGEDLLEGSGGSDNSSTSTRATSGGGSPEEGGGGSGPSTTSTSSTTMMSSTMMSTTVASTSSTGMGGSTGGDVWVNELHYDNAGGDLNEGLEIAGPAGTDLTGWTIVIYNGSNGMISTTGGTFTLSGTIPSQMSSMGTKWFTIPGLENGMPDGIALVDDNNIVIQFLSYEGTFTATGGPAIGLMAEAIPVDEEPGPAAGTSLQLTGNGSSYADFTWAEGVAASPDAINAGQNLQ